MAIEYRELGSTGVKVSPLCLGAMMFGAWGNTDHDESVSIIHRALDAGINFIDTADVYRVASPRDRGQGARRRPARLGGARHQGSRHDGGGSQSIRKLPPLDHQEVENSLRRLGTDWIDLYQIHRPEPDTDIDRDARRSQRPRPPPARSAYIGSSTFPAARSSRRNGPPSGAVASASCASSLPTRCSSAASRPRVLRCVKNTAWRDPVEPLAGGWLSGKYTSGSESPDSSRRAQ